MQDFLYIFLNSLPLGHLKAAKTNEHDKNQTISELGQSK